MPNKRPSRRPRRPTPPDPIKSMIDALNQAAYDAITNSADSFIDRLFNPQAQAQPPITPPSSNPNPHPRPNNPKTKANPRSSPSTTSLYDVLQISPKADPEMVTAAYRSLAKRFHPDIYKGKDGDDKMKAITGAYQILSDPERRKNYDRIFLRS